MKIHVGVPLSEILFYRIGGRAAYVLECTSEKDIVEAVQFIEKNSLREYLVIGLGTNLVVADTPFEGAVIWVREPIMPDITFSDDGLIAVFAGHTLDQFTQYAFSYNLTGLENLGGLPSTIGGAIRGNAGAFGVEMKDLLDHVQVLDVVTHTKHTLRNQDCHFGYRDSIFKHRRNLIILRGVFKLKQASEEEIAQAERIYKEKIVYRIKHHPVEYPSCGSIFKNIREKDQVEEILAVWPDIREQVETKWFGKVSMGYVIKRLGFSGIQVGGAKITEKHANYISNIGNAKASDVLAIIEQIKTKFQQTFGFVPELEAEVVQH